MSEPSPLHVVVRDLTDALRPERLPAQIFPAVPSAGRTGPPLSLRAGFLLGHGPIPPWMVFERVRAQRRDARRLVTLLLTPAPTASVGRRRNRVMVEPRGTGMSMSSSGSHTTLRWSKGDSNSPSHPERQRSEGRHMGPAHRSRFRSRAAVIVTLAALPILWTPNVVVARMVVGGFRVAIPGALLFAADGWIATGYVFVWQIALTRCRATRPRGSPGLAQTLAPLAGNRGFESTSLQRRVQTDPLHRRTPKTMG